MGVHSKLVAFAKWGNVLYWRLVAATYVDRNRRETIIGLVRTAAA